MSSRISFLIGTEKNSKNVYIFITRLYRVRSSIVHGDSYEDELKKIKSMTFQEATHLLDRITRVCIRKYLNLLVHLKKKQKESIIEYIDDKILSSKKKNVVNMSKGLFDLNIEKSEILLKSIRNIK